MAASCSCTCSWARGVSSHLGQQEGLSLMVEGVTRRIFATARRCDGEEEERIEVFAFMRTNQLREAWLKWFSILQDWRYAFTSISGKEVIEQLAHPEVAVKGNMSGLRHEDQGGTWPSLLCDELGVRTRRNFITNRKGKLLAPFIQSWN